MLETQSIARGEAYVIPGIPAPALWLSAGLPAVRSAPDGGRRFELSSGPLPTGLVSDFRSWIRSELELPSRASALMLEYLGHIEPHLSLRGLQLGGEATPAFWMEIAFPDAGAQRAVSARVAVHWAAHWYGAQRGRISRDHLLPFGFTPYAVDHLRAEPPCFLPAAELGYLEYLPAGRRGGRELAFELDRSVVRVRAGDPLLQRLDEAFGDYMRDERCRCQLCEPGLADVAPL